jgi:hypothetical protein
MIQSAAANGNFDALQLLFGVDRPMSDVLLRLSPRIYESYNGQCLFYLAASGTALHAAVGAGQFERVKLLLQHEY